MRTQLPLIKSESLVKNRRFESLRSGEIFLRRRFWLVAEEPHVGGYLCEVHVLGSTYSAQLKRHWFIE
jgi:hypothetical protein